MKRFDWFDWIIGGLFACTATVVVAALLVFLYS